jgi:hypothetical protein
MIVLETPKWSGISAIIFKGHVLVRRTRTDKNGRKYSYGDYYSASFELKERWPRFCSGELQWMKEAVNKYQSIIVIPLEFGYKYQGIGVIKR